jgi:YqaJ-like viral recombinase domain
MPPLLNDVSTSLAYCSTDRSLLPFDLAPVSLTLQPPPIVHHVAQRSAAWGDLRVGKVTGTGAYYLLPRKRLTLLPSTARRDYLWQLVREALTGRSHASRFESHAMRCGRVVEPKALRAYAARTGYTLHTTGFVQHPTLPAGASLDAHVGDADNFEGIVEVKASVMGAHLAYGLTGRIPRDHRAQITHALWLTNAAWCDFVSFDDRLPVGQLHILRVVRDERHIAWYDGLVRAFCAELTLASSVAGFFKTADLGLAREVHAVCTRQLESRGGLSPRRAA